MMPTRFRGTRKILRAAIKSWTTLVSCGDRSVVWGKFLVAFSLLKGSVVNFYPLYDLHEPTATPAVG